MCLSLAGAGGFLSIYSLCAAGELMRGGMRESRKEEFNKERKKSGQEE